VALSAALRVELELELEVEARSCAPVGWPACLLARPLPLEGGGRATTSCPLEQIALSLSSAAAAAAAAS